MAYKFNGVHYTKHLRCYESKAKPPPNVHPSTMRSFKGAFRFLIIAMMVGEDTYLNTGVSCLCMPASPVLIALAKSSIQQSMILWSECLKCIRKI